MEGGVKYLKSNKKTKKYIKHYKNVLRSLRRKHLKTASAKLRRQHQIAQTMKRLDKLRRVSRRRRAPLRNRVSVATAVSSPITQKYASSHIQPIVSARSSPSSNLTVVVPSPPSPIEPSEHLGTISPNSTILSIDDITPDLSPVPSSIGTDTSMTPTGANAPVVNISPITMNSDTHSDQGSLHMSDLGNPSPPNTASPATTVATNSM